MRASRRSRPSASPRRRRERLKIAAAPVVKTGAGIVEAPRQIGLSPALGANHPGNRRYRAVRAKARRRLGIAERIRSPDENRGDDRSRRRPGALIGARLTSRARRDLSREACHRSRSGRLGTSRVTMFVKASRGLRDRPRARALGEPGDPGQRRPVGVVAIGAWSVAAKADPSTRPLYASRPGAQRRDSAGARRRAATRRARRRRRPAARSPLRLPDASTYRSGAQRQRHHRSPRRTRFGVTGGLGNEDTLPRPMPSLPRRRPCSLKHLRHFRLHDTLYDPGDLLRECRCLRSGGVGGEFGNQRFSNYLPQVAAGACKSPNSFSRCLVPFAHPAMDAEIFMELLYQGAFHAAIKLLSSAFYGSRSQPVCMAFSGGADDG